MIYLMDLVERNDTAQASDCDQCGQRTDSHQLSRWPDGDGLAWLCRDCLRSAIHEHDAAIADRAANMLEHGPALHRDDLHAIARAAFPRCAPTVRIPLLVGRLGPARVPTLRGAL